MHERALTLRLFLSLVFFQLCAALPFLYKFYFRCRLHFIKTIQKCCGLGVYGGVKHAPLSYFPQSSFSLFNEGFLFYTNNMLFRLMLFIICTFYFASKYFIYFIYSFQRYTAFSLPVVVYEIDGKKGARNW